MPRHLGKFEFVDWHCLAWLGRSYRKERRIAGVRRTRATARVDGKRRCLGADRAPSPHLQGHRFPWRQRCRTVGFIGIGQCACRVPGSRRRLFRAASTAAARVHGMLRAKINTHSRRLATVRQTVRASCRTRQPACARANGGRRLCLYSARCTYYAAPRFPHHDFHRRHPHRLRPRLPRHRRRRSQPAAAVPPLVRRSHPGRSG
ncbi:hypothetical protein A3768_2884 [Ralstonia solanacearum]|nr:hypothetical protein A3768_2884 [Ralstonia solanacearum]